MVERPHKQWVYKKTFKNAEEATEFIENEEIWSQTRCYDSFGGTRCEFRCNLVKKRGPQCDAAIYLLYHVEDFEVDLLQSF
jgi:hypothetical protein